MTEEEKSSGQKQQEQLTKLDDKLREIASKTSDPNLILELLKDRIGGPQDYC